jgi:hypothetical protein
MMTDTTPEAAAVQLHILRQLAPAERLRLAMDMSAMARALFHSRIRGEHPDWSEPAIDREVLRKLLPTAELPPRYR